MKKPLVLTIIDGLGLAPKSKGNAFYKAKTPFLDELQNKYPLSILKAAGKEVGLPEGQIGNSEVGHINIGAGQIVYTGLSLINKAIEDDQFKLNEAFLKAIEHAQKNDSTLHLMGLLSSGGVHSHQEHLYEIMKLAFEMNLEKVVVHAFTDGRDVAPRSVKPFLEKLDFHLQKYNYQIGTIMGRLYAMDRDQNFDKTEIAYQALQGKAENNFDDVLEYVDSQYQEKNLNDEFLEPAVNKIFAKNDFLNSNDSVIFFNFRPDRARQISHFLIGSDLYSVNPSQRFENILLVTMMKYEKIDKSLVAFKAMKIETPLGKVLSEANLKQLRIAETQKYAHVTFFMDGGKDIEYPNQERILINSLKVSDFTNYPNMSAIQITDTLLPILKDYDIVIMNYANPDMIGHTGSLNSTIKAVELIDNEIKRLKEKVDQLGGVMFITADHGNAEIMLDQDGNPATKHTTSDVFLIVTDENIELVQNSKLANIAPTILDYLGLKKPQTMVEKSLIIKN